MFFVKFAAYAAMAQSGPSLAAKVDAILAEPPLAGALVSVTITDQRGSTLYSRNSETRVVPASNQKLLSTIFAFSTLGPEYRPVTRFAKSGNKVYVDAPGDPTLTSDNLKEIGKTMRISGRYQVLGRLAYNPGYGPSWEFDDLPNRYAPKIAAFSVDEAGFAAKSKDGNVMAIPPQLQVKLLRRPDETGPKSEYDPASGVLIVRGTLPKADSTIDTLAQPRPLATAAAYLGGKWVGMVASFPPDLNWTPFVGKPLSEVVKECLVDSDNHHAEHLLMMAAGKLAPLEPRKEYAQAAERMRAFYAGILGDPSDFRPIDGSGLSRHNFVTTRGIAQILVWAQGQPWFNQYYDCLVQSGIGTLKGRNSGASFHGKTGTLNSVVALSGYIINTVGERRIVSVVFNHGVTSSSQQRDLADKLMRTVEEDAAPPIFHETLARSSAARPANPANAGSALADGHRVP